MKSSKNLPFTVFYHRLLGGYDRLDNLRLEDALQDLTGCVLDALTFHDLSIGNELRRVEMFEALEQALSDGAIVLLCTKVSARILPFS